MSSHPLNYWHYILKTILALGSSFPIGFFEKKSKFDLLFYTFLSYLKYIPNMFCIHVLKHVFLPSVLKHVLKHDNSRTM